MSFPGQEVQSKLRDGFELALVRMCGQCNGAGTLTDRSSAAAQTQQGMPIESMPHSVKCPDCNGGWQFRQAHPIDFMKWLVEELKTYVQQNPQEFLNQFVAATETILTKDP